MGEIHTLGGSQRASIISEPGLYKLIARSTKPEARRFDRWVRHEVLPQIRKTGDYLTADADIEAVALGAEGNLKRDEVPYANDVK